MRTSGTQVTSPLLRAGEPGLIAARLKAFYAACGQGCNDPASPAYIHINAVNAFAGPWNRAGLEGCRDAASYITGELTQIVASGDSRPWYVTNWSRLGTSNITAQVEAMEALPLFFVRGSPIQRVYWFGATDYGGGSSNNFLTTVVANGETLGNIWKAKCDAI
jgi:hypothetical protein